MPSSYTASLRLELQAAGENLNTWGAPRLNNAIDRIDQAIAGRTAITLAGDRTLTSANASDDEARRAILDFDGEGPATVTIPAVSKLYAVRNGASGIVTLTTGGGATARIDAGEIGLVVCDGTNVVPLGFDGESLKAYVDAVAWAYNAGALPAQAGNAGRFVKTDGESAGWAAITVGDITDYAAAADELRAFAIAAAVAL